MKKRQIILSVLVVTPLVFGGDMNRISTTTYYNESEAKKEYNFFNGFSQPVEKQEKLNYISGKTLVTGIYRDELWRDSLIIKEFAFTSSGGTYLDLFKTNGDVYTLHLLSLADSYHPLAGGYPYIEKKYSDEFFDKEKMLAEGKVGLEYSLDLTSGHHSSNNYDTPLEVTNTDPNGNITRQFLSPFGYVDSIIYEGNIREKFVYDVHDSLVSKTLKDQTVSYVYSPDGLLLELHTVDRGVSKMRYNKRGDLRFVKNARHAAWDAGDASNEHYLINDYDVFGRIVQVSEYIGIHSFEAPTTFTDEAGKTPKRISYYDTLSLDDFSGFRLGVAPEITAEIISTIKNARGKQVASVEINANGLNVIDIISYDDESRPGITYKKIPQLPLQKTVYSYDRQGNITKALFQKLVDSHWEDITIKEYDYNSNGLLVEVKVDGSKTISYRYDELKRVTSKKFYQNGSEVEGMSYTYTINGWNKEIKSTGPDNLFSEKLYYGNDDPGTGFDNTITKQFNGNINHINFSGELDGITAGYELNLSYHYDNLNRLSAVAQGVDASDEDPFDEKFTYDDYGRLTSKKEGTNDLPGYVYKSNSNHLKYITGSSKEQVGADDNYLYDPNGNMVLDRSKNMVIEYDWKDMPVAFRFYSNIPASLTWSTLSTLLDEELVSLVEMVYDASNKRVLKLSYKAGN